MGLIIAANRQSVANIEYLMLIASIQICQVRWLSQISEHCRQGLHLEYMLPITTNFSQRVLILGLMLLPSKAVKRLRVKLPNLSFMKSHPLRIFIGRWPVPTSKCRRGWYSHIKFEEILFFGFFQSDALRQPQNIFPSKRSIHNKLDICFFVDPGNCIIFFGQILR